MTGNAKSPGANVSYDLSVQSHRCPEPSTLHCAFQYFLFLLGFLNLKKNKNVFSLKRGGGTG